MIMFHHLSDSNVPSPTPTLLCSTISPTPMFLLRLQRCYVPPFLRLQCSFSDSNVAMFHHFSDSDVPSPTPTLLCPTISPTSLFLLRLQRCYVPPFIRLQCSFSDSNVAMFHHFSDLASFLKNSKNLLVIFYMYVHHHQSNNKSLFNIIYTVLSKSPFIYTFFHWSSFLHCFLYVTLFCFFFPSKWLIFMISRPFKFFLVHWCRGYCPF